MSLLSNPPIVICLPSCSLAECLAPVTLVVPQQKQSQRISFFPVINHGSIVTQKAHHGMECYIKQKTPMPTISSIVTQEAQLDKGLCIKKKPPLSTIVLADPMPKYL